MILVVTVLAALPLGLWCRNAALACTLYVALYGWALTFQTLYLLLPTLDGDEVAFQPDVFPLTYGLVTLGVLVSGLALVGAGRWVRARRAAPLPIPA